MNDYRRRIIIDRTMQRLSYIWTLMRINAETERLHHECEEKRRKADQWIELIFGTVYSLILSFAVYVFMQSYNLVNGG